MYRYRLLCTIEGFHLTSYQVNFASHYDCDPQVDFLLATVLGKKQQRDHNTDIKPTHLQDPDLAKLPCSAHDTCVRLLARHLERTGGYAEGALALRSSRATTL